MSFSATVKEELKKAQHGIRDDHARLLAAAFLNGGSVNDPRKGYHLEFVCADEESAQHVLNAAASYDVHGKVTARKEKCVVYFKEGEDIVTLLGAMGAPLSLMNMENQRIVNEMRAQVNRRVNCETANIGKTVTAAARQLQDIRYLEQKGVLDRLEQTLQEVCEVRLAYPDATLAELGRHLHPPVGKSGVNHRLRRISEIAEQMRRT